MSLETTLDVRLQTLHDELRKGSEQMEQLDGRRRELRETMLRIAGAIQVLEEIAAEVDATPVT
jgi:hypothetical protein